MSNKLIFNWYFTLFDSLSDDLKVKLISHLAKRLDLSFNNENEVLTDKNNDDKFYSLFGVWKGEDIDGDEIVLSRSISDKNYDL